MASEARRRPFAKSRPEDEVGDGLWNAYLDTVEGEDKASVESWNGSTTGILTFTGLFAATVAAFVIESYKQLQPDTGAQTVALLAQLVSASNTTPAVPILELPSEPFAAPRAAVIVNSLWFLSLVISLVCALLATLIQEWTRDFLRDIQRRTPDMTIKEYALNHIFVRMGVEHFKLDYVSSLIVALIHVAVILFIVGLAIFIHQIHNVPAIVLESVGGVAAFIYVVLSAMPLWDHSCPYRTPLTYAFIALQAILICALIPIVALVFSVIGGLVNEDVQTFYKETPLIELLKFALAFMRPLLRFVLYRSLPSGRYLPGHRQIPMDISDTLFELSADKIPEQRRFVDDRRISFIWERVGEHLLGEGDPTLIRYVLIQVLDPVTRDYGSFFLYLRLDAVADRIVKRLGPIGTVDDGIGILRLVQLLISAENGRREASLDPFQSGRFEGMKSVMDQFPDIAQKLNTIIQTGSGKDAVNMFVALSEFRWTLILVRTKILHLHARSQTVEDGPDDIEFLDNMLMALEEIKGFRLLSLYSNAHGLQKVDFEWHRGDVLWGLELAARNTLTLLAHLIVNFEYLEQEYWPRLIEDSKRITLGPGNWEYFWDDIQDIVVLPDMWNWRTGLARSRIKLHSQAIPRQRASSIFVHLLDYASSQHGLEIISKPPLPLKYDMKVQDFVAYTVYALTSLVSDTRPSPSEPSRTKLQYEQEWKDLGFVMPLASKDPCSDLALGVQEEPLQAGMPAQPSSPGEGQQHEPVTSPAFDHRQPSDRLITSIPLLATGNLTGTSSPRKDEEAYHTTPGGLVGPTRMLSESHMAAEVVVPFPPTSKLPIVPVEEDAAPGAPGALTSAFIVEEEPPDSPSLRSAEEGGPGIEEADASQEGTDVRV